MAVAKARLLQPLDYITVGVNHRALVIGGGVAGMTSALALADQGYEVHLVERKDRLGGNALKLHTTWRGGLVKPRLDALIRKVTNNDKITIHYNAMVEGVSGVVGNFTSTLSTGEDIDHGIVVIAIGGRTAAARRHVPLQGEPQRPALPGPGSGDRREERAPENRPGRGLHPVRRLPHPGAALLQQGLLRPLGGKRHQAEGDEPGDGRLHPLPGYAHLRRTGDPLPAGPGTGGDLHPLSSGGPPRVEEADGRLKITVTDQILQRPVSFMVDLLTLATAIIPHQNAPLAELYKIPLNAEGFFTEAHAKIKPVEAATEGIFLAGLCHYPKPMQESVAEALACASRANTILSRDFLQLESIISNPIDENCDGCAFCVDTCPFKAITLLEYMKDGDIKKTVEVNPIQCKGCGSCMATCPKRASTWPGLPRSSWAPRWTRRWG